MSDTKQMIAELPDPAASGAFLGRLGDVDPGAASKLRKNEALLADVLALVSYSPLLTATMLQNPSYIAWLGRERSIAGVRSKAELLESLARFSLTNSTLDPHVLLARFRRRELLRIFLADIRRLATVAEITEDISNLADAVLENALMLARQKVDNQFGHPLEHADTGRARPAGFCVVSLGKLGSRELNYSSDIDLLFIYSAEGETDGHGSRGPVSNREYFAKLAEEIVRLTSRQTGEGAAYRVDMRLRPNGSIGPLAMSLGETLAYYKTTARDWERQVLIRSRPSAGEGDIYKKFFGEVDSFVFRPDISPLAALQSVRRSKQQIDEAQTRRIGFDVKLGRGGIREIEFIAQALQLAYGGRDRWLRAPHTLISLARLAERDLISQIELTQLFDAYSFLRRLEHILQMEHGLQTHEVPKDPTRRELVARRMNCDRVADLNNELQRHVGNVARVFDRVFGNEQHDHVPTESHTGPLISITEIASDAGLQDLSPYLKAIVTASANPQPIAESSALADAAARETSFSERLAALRIEWTRRLAEIAESDAGGRYTVKEAKAAQTVLAEESISAAIEIARLQANAKLRFEIPQSTLLVFGLGKLASGGLDYESDLDVVLTFDETVDIPSELTQNEFYARMAEWFVTALSGVTREGSLYRIDLRLRPFGKNGPIISPNSTFMEYIKHSAAIWEFLAYLKIRAVAGGLPASQLQESVIELLFARATQIGPDQLAEETRRIRSMLEKQRVRGREIDIKYGAGGMLDIYFAARFLQLRDNVRDEENRRSTAATLDRLRECGSLTEDEYRILSSGYEFLSRLDHAVRLVHGRTTRLPTGKSTILEKIAKRAGLASTAELYDQIAIHRLSIRDIFDRLVMGR